MGRAAKTNLRSNAGNLIGRAQELATLTELLDQGARLITVCGPAGTGKTRVAEAFAARSRFAFDRPGDGGVWFVGLDDARSLDRALGAIKGVLQIPPGPHDSSDEAVARLGAALAARGPVLLVLDNFEQLVETTSEALAQLLAAAPDLRIVVTSREALGIEAEARVLLGPLSLPTGEDVAASDAVQLFAARVARDDPSFAVTPTNAAIVAALVHRLDGIPLALELAASRVELLGLETLFSRLEHRFDVLATTARGGVARHATLSTAIGWSWDMLPEPERRTLAHCSVFRGGFTAAMAHDVLGLEHGHVIDRLQSLRAKSLLHRQERPGFAPRFRLLHSVQAFASERLDPQSRAETADRHARTLLEAAEPWALAVGGPDGVAALANLELEVENLRGAHEHLRSHRAKDPQSFVRLTMCLTALASVRGTAQEQRRLVEDSLEGVQPRAIDVPLHVRALTARGKVRLRQGQSATALRDLEHALELAEGQEAPGPRAEVLVELALYHHHRRELSSARELYDRALREARAAGAAALEGRVLGNLGALQHDSRCFDLAAAHYHDALGLLQTAGAHRLEAIHVANLGILEQEQGRHAQARAHFDAACELLEALGDQRLLAIVHGNLGNLEHELGRATEARVRHERALALLREAGDRRSEALCLGRLARANASLAWLDDARGCLQAADRLLGRYPDPLARAAIEVDRGFLELAAARQARACGDAQAAGAAMQRAGDSIRTATAGREGSSAWVALSDDIRTAVRTLERELARADTGADAGTAPSRPALVVGPEGRWMRPPGKDPQDLRRRRSLRLILAALTTAHGQTPGAGIPLGGLLAAGWPGERVVPSAGANRVYVALTTLRKLGLRGHLLSQDDGYLLDPALPVERSDGSWDSLRASG